MSTFKNLATRFDAEGYRLDLDLTLPRVRIIRDDPEEGELVIQEHGDDAARGFINRAAFAFNQQGDITSRESWQSLAYSCLVVGVDHARDQLVQASREPQQTAKAA